ncbi:MAG: hypothetical protein NZ853_02825 [Leptospiraceae bacterium]|nr:hypothetical protein [Leptospiraceae bacterium]MDW7975109.1 hypothetical protein [Leptospiraceae bacterium]
MLFIIPISKETTRSSHEKREEGINSEEFARLLEKEFQTYMKLLTIRKMIFIST